MKKEIKCYMGCNGDIRYKDTKTNEFLCEEHGSINLEIYRSNGERIKMFVINIEEDLF